MGFNKRHIDKEKIISTFKEHGAKGVVNLYRADAIFMPADSPVCFYIDKIMSKEETTEYKESLIETYMIQLLEGLYEFR